MYSRSAKDSATARTVSRTELPPATGSQLNSHSQYSSPWTWHASWRTTAACRPKATSGIDAKVPRYVWQA